MPNENGEVNIRYRCDVCMELYTRGVAYLPESGKPWVFACQNCFTADYKAPLYIEGMNSPLMFDVGDFLEFSFVEKLVSNLSTSPLLGKTINLVDLAAFSKKVLVYGPVPEV